MYLKNQVLIIDDNGEKARKLFGADLSMEDAISTRWALLELSRRSHVSRSKSEQRQLIHNV
jgi:hypothetical protein